MRGIQGTAEVLSAKRTRMVIQEGEFDWEAPRVYKYRLRVTIPGRAPYETDCSICASGISEGSAVNVAVSPHNHRRVTIDVGQGSKGRRGTARPGTDPGFAAASALAAARGQHPPGQAAAEAQRPGMLAQLGQLHRQGILTDSEFAAQKAQILGE